MPLTRFHPAVRAWFETRFGTATLVQQRAWPAISSGHHALVAAPTGSGKTLAAFLAALDDLFRQGLAGTLADETQVVYVSPLKALSHDIQKNLQEPLLGIRAELASRGLPDVDVRTFVRTGDTEQAERARMRKRNPHVLVTTPESLYILLTSVSGREMLKTTRTVIVDEIHAVARDKRGSHLALSLERLEALTERPLARIGLSATQRPIEDVARFLVGAGNLDAAGLPDCEIVDEGHARTLDLGLELPLSPLSAVMPLDAWKEIQDRLADLARAHRTTLIFTNTRRLCERLGRALAERLGEDAVTTHHGSLSREHRLDSEMRLKEGRLRALVATSSLELGIDIGDVDLVCQIGSTRSIAAFLQRVGRSGHGVGRVPKGRLFPTTRDELMECLALLSSTKRGELDRLVIPERAADILAQQIVAEVACREWGEDELFECFTRAWPYRNLARSEFDDVLGMLADGFSTRRGRRGAHLHRDEVNGRLRGRKASRLIAMTSGGAIPDLADYDVVLEPAGTRVGSINEDFAIESIAGDIFQLGNTSWRILRVEPGKVRVEDARGQPPNMPFWLGEAPGRTNELSASVSRLREELDARLATGTAHAMAWLHGDTAASEEACLQAVEYAAVTRAALGCVPSQHRLVLERFTDEASNMHLVLHAPFGSRINRAWGLSLRKRFCRQFNFELQAAATEDAIVLSLGPTHSFELAEVFDYLRAATVRHVLEQAVLAAPVFGTRWRWNATRSLALPRFFGSRKVPVALQRMQAEDLLAVVFPDQLACAENLAGEREIPQHPLVDQTLRDCLEEAMDLPGLTSLLRSMEAGERTLVARDLAEPSPMAAEVLSARPYAFLDDAPLEERRTQAVLQRRWLDPESASDLGALDIAAIERVRQEAFPEATTPDELHDALVVHGVLTDAEGRERGWTPLLEQLAHQRRATMLIDRDFCLWVAAERLPQWRAVLPAASLAPFIEAPPRREAEEWTRETALVELVRGRLEMSGPVTCGVMAATLGLPPEDVNIALHALEREGFVMRGRFTGAHGDEWCERRLLARIHRATIHRLRAEIEPVTTSDFLHFLMAWQRLGSGQRAKGAEGVAAVLEQFAGFQIPAGAWEGDALPARVDAFRTDWLDALCASGRIAWARRAPGAAGARGPVRATPLVLVPREQLPQWLHSEAPDEESLSTPARQVRNALVARGALFFAEISRMTSLLRTQAEDALSELVAAGVVTCDSFRGLRGLIAPKDSAVPAYRRRAADALAVDIVNAGRWSLLPREAEPEGAERNSRIESIARVLLKRWGVVFRKVLDREEGLPPWRELVRVLHRLEARGEIRGGRFVSGPSGEQFALPEAVVQLRALRREERRGALVSVSAADPMNLIGIITPGRLVPAIGSNRILFRDGEPIATLEADEPRWLVDVPASEQWELEKALRRSSWIEPRVPFTDAVKA